MKKAVAVTAGVAIVGVAGWLGATWYTGKRMEAELPALLQQSNDKLAEALPGYGARVEQLSYERGFFSSRARYGIVIPGPADAEDGPLLPPGLVEVDATVEHGPFPRSAVVRGQLLPKLGFVHSELVRTQGMEPLFAAAGGQSPLAGDTALSYNGDSTGTARFAPLELEEAGQGKLSFSGATVQARYTRAAEAVKGNIAAGSLQLHLVDAQEGPTSVALEGLAVEIDTRMGKHGLTLGDTRMSVRRLTLGEPGSGLQASLDQLAYDLSIGEDDTTLNAQAGYRIGKLTVGGQDFGSGQAVMKMADFDGAATKRVMDSYRRLVDLAWAGDAGRASDAERQALVDELLADTRALLAAGPSIALAPLSWQTPEGESRVTLSLALTQPGEAASGSVRELVQQSVKTLEARASLSKPMMQDMVARYLVAGGATPDEAAQEARAQVDMVAGLADMLQMGRNEGDNIVSVLRYADGKAQLNDRDIPVEQLFGSLPDAPPQALLDQQAGTEAGSGGAAMMQQLGGPDVQALVAEAGYAARIERDEHGDPVLRIEPGDSGAETIEVDFYDCEADACDSIMLNASFAATPEVGLETINAWNRANRWTRAYLDEDGRVALEMDVNAYGGIGQESLRNHIRTFLDSVREFGDEVQ